MSMIPSKSEQGEGNGAAVVIGLVVDGPVVESVVGNLVVVISVVIIVVVISVVIIVVVNFIVVMSALIVDNSQAHGGHVGGKLEVEDSTDGVLEVAEEKFILDTVSKVEMVLEASELGV
jgi:hypothetical protein